MVAAVLALALAATAVAVAYRTVGRSTSTGDATSSGATVPPGWKTYHRADAGYTVAYPPTWQVQNNGSFTDFREPGTGTYLRVDWTANAGPSALEAWNHLADGFKAKHAGYQQLRLEPTHFAGSSNAATWEFTYTDQGAALHAIDIGFVSGSKGYAFNFQTHADRWDAAQPLMKQLEAGFRVGS